MRPLTNFALHSILAAALVAFAASSAAAGDAAYIKFDGIDGEIAASSSDKPRIAVLEAQGSGAKGGGHGGQIEVESFSWGSTQTGVGSATGGAGAGKVKFNEFTIKKTSDKASPLAGSGEKGGTEDINIGVGELQEGKKKGNVEYSWKVEAGEKAPPAPGGGVSVAAGDVTGDGQPAPRKPTIGRATISPKSLPMAERGSLSALVPQGSCKVGARYPGAEFGTPGRTYRLSGVVVTDCSTTSATASRPMETMSLNYEKITWK